MDIREKLVELLDTNCGYVDEVEAEVLADHLISNGVTVQEWISVEDRLPEEHDTIFKKFQNTEKWNCSMFEKVSDNVNVYGYYQDGNKFVTTSTTRDGKWNISSIFQMTVTHWMPLPEPPEEEV